MASEQSELAIKLGASNFGEIHEFIFHKVFHRFGVAKPDQKQAAFLALSSDWPAQDAHRKRDNGLYQIKCAAHSNAHEPKWQQQQPNDRVEHQSNQGQGPTQHQKNAPQ